VAIRLVVRSWRVKSRSLAALPFVPQGKRDDNVFIASAWVGLDWFGFFGFGDLESKHELPA
jgi:hypothetical protein